MFDVSWGELIVIGGMSFVLIGRKDLPKAANIAGKQVGRVVGFIQGGRMRADRFTSDQDLSKLQSDLRMGLRELDAVRSELASSTTMSRGMMTAGTSAIGSRKPSDMNTRIQSGPSPNTVSSFLPKSPSIRSEIGHSSLMTSQLPPRAQTVAAVAEEEWGKRGIGFKARAEMNTEATGSAILSKFLQETLVHDQYERAMREQNDLLEGKKTITENESDHESSSR
mmetsp:Transcript_37278/g.57233  ORF Transcript_37278/g.57233 Transcript_37278/m.57233 type:complete len:224 (-) Transcript_37278:524-1195(-)